MKKVANHRQGKTTAGQARRLHRSISALMREFKVTPALLEGSGFADLHVNDLGVLDVLAGRNTWTVNQVAMALSSPLTTISSALDRLDKLGLVERKRISTDRRVVKVELTIEGKKLTTRMDDRDIDNCIAMLDRLASDEREEFLCMMEHVAELDEIREKDLK